MNIIDRLFNRKVNTSVNVLKFNLDELNEYILLESDKETKQMEPLIKEKYTKISILINDIPNLILSLQTASEDISSNKKIKKVGFANKGNIIHNLQLIQDKILLPNDHCFEKAMEFCEIAKSTIRTVSINTHKSQLYIKAIYPEQSQQIITILSALEDQVDDLIVILVEKKDWFNSINHISDEIENFNSIKKTMSDTTLNVLKIEKKIQEIQFNIQKTNVEMQQLEQSKDMKKVNELETKLKQSSEELHDINQKIQRMFSSLSKIFFRMDKQDKNEKYVLSLNNRKILDVLIADPISALNYDLASFFNEVKYRIEDGSLGLKDQFAEKALNQINKINNSEELNKLYMQYLKITELLAQDQNKLKNINAHIEKEKLVSINSNNKKVLNELEIQREKEKNQLSVLDEQTQLLISNICMKFKTIFHKEVELIN